MTSRRPTVGHLTLGRLTAAKAVANTALRWLAPFLPTLEAAFGASTTQLTTILGASEFAGLSTIGAGPHLDGGRERTVMVASLGLITVSSVVALGGTLVTFAVAAFVLVLGVSNLTVAGHAWISHRVDYRWRARSIGLFETSWALALLIGAPAAAVLINLFGWRAPFVVLAVLSAAAAVMVATSRSGTAPAIVHDVAGVASPQPRRSRARITSSAWLVMVGSAALATTGLSVFVVSGSWLNDAFGVSTGGIGAVAMSFGAMELVASSSTAAFADCIGKLHSTIAGAVTACSGLIVMVFAGDRLAVGITGLLVFLLGFEFGFVTSLSLISEAMPDARGTTLAIGNAVGTVARAGGAIVGGWLYGIHGIHGTATLSGGAAALSVTCLVLSRRT